MLLVTAQCSMFAKLPSLNKLNCVLTNPLTQVRAPNAVATVPPPV
jgi:hypothetical protein